MTYQQAEQLYNTCRNKDRGKPLRGRQGRTRLIRTEQGYGIKYCDTVIVEILPNGHYVLNSGGYRTVSTKAKMNEFSPARVSQRALIRYVGDVTYIDGIKVDGTGKPLSTTPEQVKVKAEKRIKKIKEFVKGFVAAIAADKIPKPSGGDCWYCAMKETGTGKPLGEAMASHDHLDTHIKERYYVPSLLVNALSEAGYNVAFVNPWVSVNFGGADQYKHALTKYLVKRVG